MKRFTLLAAALLFCGFSMNAQSDCSNAEVITVGANASVTVNSAGVTGTAPTQICNGYNYTTTDISAGAWYSYTNSGTQDMVVTVTGPVPAANSDYFPSFNILSGSCGSLTCVGGSIITQTTNAVDSFVATVGTTYYIVFDDLYANQSTPAGTTAAFDFTVTTDSNVPALPGVATNPTPADGATNVPYYTIQDDQGSTFAAMDFAWDIPTTGGTVDSYFIEISSDPTFPSNTGGTVVTVSGSFNSNSIQGLYIPSTPDYFKDNTTYYWRVTPENVAGPTAGTVVDWSFTTGTLGVEDNQLTNVSIYPNPVVNELSIDMPSSIELESATMFDLLGKQTQVSISENNTINMSQMAAGVYILKLETNQGIMTKKIIKN